MNILAWNYRGVGAPRAIHEVTKLVNFVRPQIVFLSETKKRKDEVEWLRARWGFKGCFTMDCIGRSGGPAILWQEDWSVSIRSYSQFHITVDIVATDFEPWCFVGFYGQP
ncbi:hypothetical protein DITRI_Ditri17bG0037300 [Diplodiscus trichospermus]